MTTRAQTLDPIADGRWQAFVERMPDAMIFHHPAWMRLLHEQYGYEMLACCAVDAGDEIVGGLPAARIRSRLTGTRLVALPFSDVCPRILNAERRGEIDDVVLGSIEDEQQRLGIDFEIREAIPALRRGRLDDRFYQHRLKLDPDVAAVQARFSKSQVRRGIAKATREGVRVRRATGRDALDAFYALHVRTRRRLGVPTQPKRFIRRFADLFEQGLGFVLLADWQDKTIAAAVFLTFNRTLTYKYGASDGRHLNKRPNNALFMEAIAWGCANGQRTLDFGRTDLDNEGLRSFKRAWGAEELEVAYTRLSERPSKGDRVSTPAALRSAISHGPPVLGRVVGGTLYKHFG